MFGIVMAFLDYRLPTKKMPFPTNLLHSEFVGLDNFQFLFTRDALTMIRNTLGYNALRILLGLALSVALAIMMSELTRKFLAKTYQTLMFFPYFLSWVVAAYFLFAFLDPTNGMIVRAQRTAGLTPIDWYSDNTSVQGAMMAISANSDAPEACMKFLNLLNTDPYVMTLLNYGVEGIHYNLNDQGEAEFTDARASSYTVWTNGVGNITLLPPAKGQGAGFQKEFAEFYGGAKKLPIYGFTFDASKVNKEIAAVANIKEAYSLTLCTGASADVDATLAKMLQKMDDAGMQKIVEEANAQLEAFLAGK